MDIKAELPVFGQPLAKVGMFVWSLYSFTLLYNFVAMLAGLACKGCEGVSVSCVRALGRRPRPPCCRRA